jgi:deoxyribodipyrimidine photolyase-like uncharacterized protein
MVTGEQTMWHAMLSPYLNIGLLHPLEVVQAAQLAYLDNSSDWELNSIEGFIRQVLGWREYMHGVYVSLDIVFSLEHQHKVEGSRNTQRHTIRERALVGSTIVKPLI